MWSVNSLKERVFELTKWREREREKLQQKREKKSRFFLQKMKFLSQLLPPKNCKLSNCDNALLGESEWYDLTLKLNFLFKTVQFNGTAYFYVIIIKEQVALNKSNLLLKIILQNTQTLQLFTKIFKTEKSFYKSNWNAELETLYEET